MPARCLLEPLRQSTARSQEMPSADGEGAPGHVDEMPQSSAHSCATARGRGPLLAALGRRAKARYWSYCEGEGVLKSLLDRGWKPANPDGFPKMSGAVPHRCGSRPWGSEWWLARALSHVRLARAQAAVVVAFSDARGDLRALGAVQSRRQPCCLCRRRGSPMNTTTTRRMRSVSCSRRCSAALSQATWRSHRSGILHSCTATMSCPPSSCRSSRRASSGSTCSQYHRRIQRTSSRPSSLSRPTSPTAPISCAWRGHGAMDARRQRFDA